MENEKWFTVLEYPIYEMNEQLDLRHKETLKIKNYNLHNGYLRTSIYFNGKKYNRYLHQLVAYTFMSNPENKPELHHIDEDKLNNHWTNLMWVTKQEHRQISKDNEQTCHKISRENVIYIRDNYSEGNCRKLAKEFDVRPITIYNIAIGKARVDVIGGKIHEAKGLHKKVVNIETGETYQSCEMLAALKGFKLRSIRRALSGERYNTTPYRYVGQEDLIKLPPIIEKQKEPIAVFDIHWNLVKEFDYINDASAFVKSERDRIMEFLRGKSSMVKGYKFKLISDDGSYAIHPQFVSKKPPLKPKRIKNAVTPSKPMIMYDISGNKLQDFSSMYQAAKYMKCERKNFMKAIKKSPRNYYKGFIFRYA